MPPPDARGFTLLELIVVLAIAGLLFSLGGPSMRTLSATRNTAMRSDRSYLRLKMPAEMPLRGAYPWTC
ncbi:MAG: hypothetical protein CBC82_05930 [Cellvibrionales bacterium TMED122]|nr:MAG: hypothetical protein CBC82_05930 [Cellvibrionales bacterium TMED122]